MLRHHRAFTLVELLVSIGVISILAALLFPVFGQAREKARQGTCMSNQHQLALLTIQYAQDHDNIFPQASTIWQDVQPPKKILRCPTTPASLQNSYVINLAITGCPVDSFFMPTETALTIDGAHHAGNPAGTVDNIAYSWRDLDKRHDNKFIVSYLDAHVELTDEIPMMVNMPDWPNMEIWFASDYGVKRKDGASLDHWLDRSSFSLHATPANKNHSPEYFPSVASLGGAPAVFFKPPNNNPNMLMTEEVGKYWRRQEATIFVVFQPTGNNDNYEYTVFDQANGDPEQATRVRQGGNGNGYSPALPTASANLHTAGSGFGAPGAPPTVTLTASAATVTPGTQVTLTWSATGATALVGSNFGVGPGDPFSGSRTVTVNDTTTYSLTATNNGKERSASVTVTVTQVGPPSVTLSASPGQIEEGDTVSLSWSSTNATSVVASNFQASKVDGSKTDKPNATTTYTITVAGPGGQATASATVTVGPKEDDGSNGGGNGTFAGRISWFRNSAAAMYPPDSMPWNTPMLLTVVTAKRKYLAYNNGVPWPAYSGEQDWLTPDYFTIGGSTHGSTANRRSFDGFIGEIIVFRRALRNDERERVEQYLRYKFAL